MPENTNLLKNFSDGFSDFAELVDYRCYYVDKTSFIKKVFARDADPHEPPKSGKILIITRPRRFGKTLLLSTFFHFLSKNFLRIRRSWRIVSFALNSWENFPPYS